MKHIQLAILIAMAQVLIAPVQADEQLRMENVDIAPVDEALTFARVAHDGMPTLLAVSSYQDGLVTGALLHDLLGDPISAFQTLGYDGLRTAVMAGESTISIPVSNLLIPVELGNRHIAAGTNFPEHADETDVTEGPFLFTKAVQPTDAFAPVSAGDGLLDYEAELCFVGFEPIDPANPPAHVGLFLCNDFTDRAALFRNIDPFDVVSGNGFTTGKSAPGFMPIGPLFVIPKDREDFAAGIELSLYVNGSLKQHAFQRQAVWDFDEIIKQAEQRRDVVWDFNGSNISLPFDSKEIPVRAAVLAGTPSGVLAQPPGFFHILAGTLKWLAGGWDKSIVYWTIEAYVEDARAQHLFLQPGDLVLTHAPYLGSIASTITD